MGVARFVLRLLLWLSPLAVALVSFVLNARLSSFGGGRVAGAVIMPGLICIYASGWMASMAEAGVRMSMPAVIPPAAFKLLGWMMVLASFVPWLVS